MAKFPRLVVFQNAAGWIVNVSVSRLCAVPNFAAESFGICDPSVLRFFRPTKSARAGANGLPEVTQLAHLTHPHSVGSVFKHFTEQGVLLGKTPVVFFSPLIEAVKE